MSTMETVMAVTGARMLIDARLDAIDRALLGRVSRGERLDVVGEVESRIDELLRVRCGSAEPSREDVLAVLARLDPPEAYLEDDPEATERPRRSPEPPPAGSADRQDREWFARASAISGLAASLMVLLLPVTYLLAVAMGSELVLFGGAAACGLSWLATAATAVILAAVSRMAGVWSIVGLVLGIVSAIPMLAAGAYLALMILQ